MKLLGIVLLITSALIAAGQHSSSGCSQCEVWNKPQPPLRIFGNTYYVGPHGLSSVLITSKQGHVLIDGALPESVPQIAANIRALGFRIEDVKIILNSHVHFDHAGGIAALQKLSGARVMASEWTAAVMRTGEVAQDDPQYGEIRPISRVANVATIRDGETVSVGDLRMTAHLTPGHTQGGTTWTWNSCEGSTCRQMVYADSLSPVSREGYQFGAHSQLLQGFEKSFAFVESAPCDVLITPHPESSGLWDRLEARTRGVTPDPIIEAGACRELAQHGREQLRHRLEQESKGSKKN